MFAAILPALAVIATWAGRIGMVLFAVDMVKNLTSGQKETMTAHSTAAASSGLPEDEQKKLVAATMYEQIEKKGKNPDDFWNGLTDQEKGVLKYSPDTVRSAMDRTSFLGTAQTVLWVAAAAAVGYGAFKGIPIVSKGLGQLIAARQRGAGATELLTFIEQTKMGILQKVWVPGTVATIAAGGGWLTGALANNMNDAFLWGPTFLDQAAADVEKASKNKGASSGGSGGGFTSSDSPRTIIRMVNESKPKQFLGTLFSLKLGKMEHFDRKLDDEITDKQDLEADVKLALARWLKTLPGRLGASISIRKEPVDEFGAKQSGIWATMTLFIQQLSGTIMPIDTLLLGPVDPVIELELLKSTKTFEVQLPEILSAEEVREIEIPDGNVDIFNKAGDRVFPGGGTTPAPTPTPTQTPAPATPAVGDEVVTHAPIHNVLPIRNGDTWDEYQLRARQQGKNTPSAGEREWKTLMQEAGFTIGRVPTPAPSAPSTGSGSGTSAPTLRVGSTGDQVKWLQEFLNTRGETLVVDGIFGARTDAAVGRFQYKEGLVSDGVVGPKTYAAISKYF